MSFTLDLAVTYACALVLFYWLVAFLVPVLFRAMTSALSRGIDRVRTRFSGGVPAEALPHTFPKVRVKQLF